MNKNIITFKNLLFNLRREYHKRQSLLNSMNHYITAKIPGVVNVQISENMIDEGFVASFKYKDRLVYRLFAKTVYPKMVEVKKEGNILICDNKKIEIDNAFTLRDIVNEIETMNLSRFMNEYESNEVLSVTPNGIYLDLLNSFVIYNPKTDSLTVNFDDVKDINKEVFDYKINNVPDIDRLFTEDYDDYKIDMLSDDKILPINVNKNDKVLVLGRKPGFIEG